MLEYFAYIFSVKKDFMDEHGAFMQELLTDVCSNINENKHPDSDDSDSYFPHRVSHLEEVQDDDSDTNKSDKHSVASNETAENDSPRDAIEDEDDESTESDDSDNDDNISGVAAKRGKGKNRVSLEKRKNKYYLNQEEENTDQLEDFTKNLDNST